MSEGEHACPVEGPLGVTKAEAAEQKWSAMLEGLVKYKEEHGSFSFPCKANALPRHERRVGYWVQGQRAEYKKLQQGRDSRLTAQRLQRLTAVGLDLTPRPETIPWETRVQSLRDFVAEHGHCRPKRGHSLNCFASNVRTSYRAREEGRATWLTDARVEDLVGVGFVFKAGKSPNIRVAVRKSWEERFRELQAYKAEHGHTLVPQLSCPLGVWVKQQRTEYRRMKKGDPTPMTAEKALRLTEMGFHFDAERFKGRNRQVE